MANIWLTDADRCGQVRTDTDNSVCWLSFLGRTFCRQVRTGADRCGKVWSLCVLSWRTLGGQVRTGADKSGSWVYLLSAGHLADRYGRVRIGADKSGTWMCLLFGGHLAYRCRRVQTTLFPGALSYLADTWRTGADRCGQVWFPSISLSWRTFGAQLRTAADKSGT